MSDALNAAIAAEMERQDCSRVIEGYPPGKVWPGCCTHDFTRWDDARDQCSVVAEIVRAGWDAAIYAAAEVVGKKQPRWGVTTDYDQGFLDGWDDHQTAAGREVRALLSGGRQP